MFSNFDFYIFNFVSPMYSSQVFVGVKEPVPAVKKCMQFEIIVEKIQNYRNIGRCSRILFYELFVFAASCTARMWFIQFVTVILVCMLVLVFFNIIKTRICYLIVGTNQKRRHESRRWCFIIVVMCWNLLRIGSIFTLITLSLTSTLSSAFCTRIGQLLET